MLVKESDELPVDHFNTFMEPSPLFVDVNETGGYIISIHDGFSLFYQNPFLPFVPAFSGGRLEVRYPFAGANLALQKWAYHV
jgi:hypothetical protein